MRLTACLLLLGLCPTASFCQTPARDTVTLNGAGFTTAPNINDKTIDKLSASYAGLNASVNNQSARLLRQLQKKETTLQGKLLGIDSSKAQQLFAGSQSAYQQLQAKLQTPITNPVSTITNYIPGIDSMKTAIQFLSKTGLPADQLQKLQSLSQQLTQLQGSLQNAGEIQNYATQRIAQLQSQLTQNGLTKQLSGMNIAAFNYQQQISQYKNILNDRQQQQQLILSAVRQLPAFQSFWQKNSMLSQLFPTPGNSGTLLSGTGLQTGAAVGKMIQQKLGTSMDDGGKSAAQYLRQQAGNAQGQVDQLKNKLDQLSLSGGSSNMVLPDNFTPNSQQKMTFLKRLELGFNIQNTAATTILPTISTFGLSLGYKLSDKATIGVGVSYLLGLGNGLNQVRLSNQGAGLRSFLDIQAHKSIWITGGLEYDYMQQFTTIKSIDNINLWQKSVLVGLMKKFKVGKHSGNVQLLYDLLATQEVPQGQALKIRFGFGL